MCVHFKNGQIPKFGLKAAAAVPLVLGAGLALGLSVPAQAAPPPDTITLTAVVRDFVERDEPGGHPDFERNKAQDADGLMYNVVKPVIDDDGKPAWEGRGTLVDRYDKYNYMQWEDSSGRPICYRLYDAALGDTPGTIDPPGESGFTTNGNFDTWYRDVPGVNLSIAVDLTLVRQADGTYVFDDKDDPLYKDRGGFFPNNDQLFGNSVCNDDHNFHFTTEIHATFVFEATAGQVFRFMGDDDVWVFINGQLVIDLAGTHNAIEQFIDVSRLGLADGETYKLDLFHAERQTKSSNFAFQTNLVLRDASLPSVSAGFD
jgi:fibro-slime domain-containing protein